MIKNKLTSIAVAVALTMVLGGYLAVRIFGGPAEEPTLSSLGPVKVVSAENFYADLVKQLGGAHVLVTSFLSDPNVDPHEYESSVSDSIAVGEASIVIENGLGYDAWMDKLIAASPNSRRIVITAGRIAPIKLPDNPHIWYGIDNIPTIAQAVTGALKKVDPADSTEYDANLKNFDNSLQPIRQKLSSMRTRYANTPVGLTETIDLYQTQALGLNVLTPFEFEKAIAEGNDPPADTVTTANDQISHRQIKVLIYSSQTVTPITTNLQNEANKLGIPVVPVSETMPKEKSYQTWMTDQLNILDSSLQTTQSIHHQRN